jgi:hypothetical protein
MSNERKMRLHHLFPIYPVAIVHHEPRLIEDLVSAIAKVKIMSQEMPFASATPYTAAPPRDKILSSNNPFACLPEGWTTAVDPTDGRIFYYNNSSGERSWRHPSAPPEDHYNSSSTKMNTNMCENTRFSNPQQEQQQQLPPPPNVSSGGMWNEHPSHATRRPDNHQCDAFAALCFCPPVGIIALYHSIQVDRCWHQGLYGESVNHARQAPKFACFGIFVGIIFWVYWIFFHEGDFKWPDWDFDWGD